MMWLPYLTGRGDSPHGRGAGVLWSQRPRSRTCSFAPSAVELGFRRGAERLDDPADDLVDEDRVRRRLAVVLELDLLGDAGEVLGLDEVVDGFASGVTGLHRVDDRDRGVVTLGRVDRGVDPELRLVLVGEFLELRVGACRAAEVAGAADDRAFGGRGTRTRHELRVERAVTSGEDALHAAVAELLEQTAGLRVVTAVGDDVRVRGLDLGNRRGVVRRVLGELVALGRDACGLEGLLERVPEADAVFLVVRDDEGGLRRLGLDQEVGDAGTLVVVVRDDTVPVLPAVLRQARVRRRRRHARDLALLEHAADGLRLT